MRSRAFGLNLHADHAIPGLVEAPDAAPEVRVHFGRLPERFPAWERAAARAPAWYVSPHLGADGQPLLTVRRLADDTVFAFQYGDGTRFAVDHTGAAIWATWPAPLTLADAATYLLGPILGFVLRLRGRVCLHASVVAVGGRALALVGPAGAGKSTTAALFARRGCAVLADDVAALDEGPNGFLVWPAYPQLRLWPASVAMLYGDAEALAPLTPNWDKRGLDLTDGPLPERPLPLAAVYLLAGRQADARAPYLEPVPPAAALMALVTHTYMNYLLDAGRRAVEFATLGRLLAQVPLRSVIPSSDAARLPQLGDVLLADFHGLCCGTGRNA